MASILPSVILGPGFYRHTPSTVAIELVMRGKLPLALPLVFGFVDVRDVVEAHIQAYERPAASGRFIASGDELPLMDLFRRMKALDPSLRIPWAALPGWLLGAAPFLDWMNSKLLRLPRLATRDMILEYGGRVQHFRTGRIRRELGWAPRPLDETLADTIEWVRRVFLQPSEKSKAEPI